MADKSIGKNFIFNLLNQIVQALGPVLVMPYISRTLGADNIGLYSYAESMVSYFVLFAILGTNTFGQRSISYLQNNKVERSRAFWETFIFRIVMSTVALIAYGGYMFFVAERSDSVQMSTQLLIYGIFALNILNVAIDITWFMQGIEEFGKTSLRNMFFRIASIVLIFIFVKDESDTWLYVLFMVCYAFLGNLSLWIYMPKYLCKVKGIRPFKDIKTILQLFLPTIAVQLYTVLDKSMLGWLAHGYAENGYYEQSEKIFRIALVAVTALGVVMIPRIARTFKEGNNEKVNDYIYKSYRFVWMMAIPIMLGLIAVTDIFVPVFFGEGYDKCKILIPIFSVLVVIIGLSNVTGIQYFIPTGKQNVLTLTVGVGAVINIVLNLILIPHFYSLGACIASVVAELSITLVGFIYIKKKKLFLLKPVFLSSLKYWIAGAVMFGVVFLIKIFLPSALSALLSLITLVIIGALVYFIILLLLKDELIFEILRKGASLLKKHKSIDCNKSQVDTSEGAAESDEEKN